MTQFAPVSIMWVMTGGDGAEAEQVFHGWEQAGVGEGKVSMLWVCLAGLAARHGVPVRSR